MGESLDDARASAPRAKSRCEQWTHINLQIVDDLGHPAWHAAWLFDVVDPSVPDDWIVSTFRTEPSLVVGPPFVARDLDAYARMVQLEMAEVDKFWKRLDRSEAGRHDGDG